MSHSVSNAFIIDYQSDVHLKYQRRGSKLKSTVRFQGGVVGKETTFQVVGKGEATAKGRHSNIPPMNLSHDPIPCPITDRYAGDYADKKDLEKLNIDERQAIAQSGANACGRAVDTMITTAMNTITATATAAWTLDAARQLIEVLADNDVPLDEGDVFGAMGYRQWNLMMKDSAFSSADFVGEHPLKNFVTPKMWSGVLWFPVSGNGLPLATGNRSVFVYHSSAVGYAEGGGIEADVGWITEKAAWFINHMFSGGACIIDPTGVAKWLATE